MGYTHIYSPRYYDYLIKQNAGNYDLIDGKTGFRVKSNNTDVGELINDAIALLPAVSVAGTRVTGGGTIGVGEGLFNLITPISLTKPVTLIGAGRAYNTCFYLVDNSDDYMLTIPSGANYHNLIRQINFNGNGGGQGVANKAIIYLDDGYLSMNDCFIMYGCYDGFRSLGGQDMSLVNVYSEFNDNNGFYFSAGQNIVVIGCTAWENGNHGIQSSVQRAFYNNCRLAYNGKSGILCEAYQVTIAGNLIEFNGNHGVYLNAATRTAVTGNVMRDNNTAAGSFDGINLTGACKRVSITGNCIGHDTANIVRYGVYLSATSEDNHVDNNCIVAGTAEYSDLGIRNLINNIGTNAGIPGAAGNWAAATSEGAIVYDTTPGHTYICIGGTWIRINT